MSGVYVSGLRVWEIVQERMADDMEMPGFYEQLRGLPQDSRNLAVTVLEGEFYGSYFNEYRSLKNGKKELERTGLCNGSFFIFRQFVNFFISKM